MTGAVRVVVPLVGVAFAALMAYAVYLQLLIWHVL
jgi:hypothetical protein